MRAQTLIPPSGDSGPILHSSIIRILLFPTGRFGFQDLTSETKSSSISYLCALAERVAQIHTNIDVYVENNFKLSADVLRLFPVKGLDLQNPVPIQILAPDSHGNLVSLESARATAHRRVAFFISLLQARYTPELTVGF